MTTKTTKTTKAPKSNPAKARESAKHIARAVEHLGATCHADDVWTYRADEDRKTYRVTRAQLEALGAALATGHPDAYSLWCSGAGSGAEEIAAEEQEVVPETQGKPKVDAALLAAYPTGVTAGIMQSFPERLRELAEALRRACRRLELGYLVQCVTTDLGVYITFDRWNRDLFIGREVLWLDATGAPQRTFCEGGSSAVPVPDHSEVEPAGGRIYMHKDPVAPVAVEVSDTPKRKPRKQQPSVELRVGTELELKEMEQEMRRLREVKPAKHAKPEGTVRKARASKEGSTGKTNAKRADVNGIKLGSAHYETLRNAVSLGAGATFGLAQMMEAHNEARFEIAEAWCRHCLSDLCRAGLLERTIVRGAYRVSAEGTGFFRNYVAA